MLRLVIGDSDTRSRKRIREIVQKQGHIIVGEAKDGLTALTQIRSTEPDLIILDARLPVMGGHEVAQIAEESRIAPVILICTFAQTESLAAYNSAVFAYVFKPVTEANLLAAIDSARRNYQKILALEQEIDQLKDSLETRKVVDRAKGLLMKKHRLSEDEAYRHIQQLAMKKRVSKKAIAEALILSLEL
ncbi:MAG TPA: ANTAR domain-containing protein [Bacillota bacterium]|nr:ANTAR domain-containing protein [Bacillota bacterium]